MTIDLFAAEAFMTTHARLLDRHRFALHFTGAGPDAALAALEAYRNADGGYSWGLEPDLRAPESQPGGALHAFEVFEEVGPATSPRAAELCDWLDSASLPDGGVPFALPVSSASGTAPFWANADPRSSSLHITAAVTAAGHRVARHDPALAQHPWLARATRYCLEAIAAREGERHALELMYSLAFLDAVAGDERAAGPLLEQLAGTIPPSGALHVQGGADDEFLRPLDFAPLPTSRVRGNLADEVVTADLDRLAGEQRDDGGWDVDFASYSPAAALEWRGYITVWALTALEANGRLPKA
jgi:hypothetical protein